jgi:hypothetical protein
MVVSLIIVISLMVVISLIVVAIKTKARGGYS